MYSYYLIIFVIINITVSPHTKMISRQKDHGLLFKQH